MITNLALFGEHIEQSYSPVFHQHFAKQFGIEINYQKITVTNETFENAWRAFVKNGGKGANVTMPCKNQAYQLCTTTSECAQKSESVNTIRVGGESLWYGDSTDGIGFIRDLVNYYHQSLTGKKILILGAGGAASGILYSILEQKPHSIIVANRTLARAEQLAARYSPINVCNFEHIPPISFDVVINTSAELPLSALRILFASKAVAYDLRYTPAAQDFLEWARQHGAENLYDGYGMLLEQAAAAFEVWFNKRPATLELRR
jgi:shikimate dehydrogenase